MSPSPSIQTPAVNDATTRSPEPCQPKRPDVSHFDKLPDAALIAIAALAAVMGKGVSTAWRDIRNDPDFPKPIRLSPGCTRFRVGDIRAYLSKKAASSHKPKRAQRVKGVAA
jgi:predicted DNA-binding transcriptional regulator AlpA